MKEEAISAGKKLGAYEIVERIGAGGMGEVYRAKDPRFKRDVAIKVLPPDFAKDPDRLQRFEQEAQAVGILNHPNILSVYDTGMIDGSPYLVSEYVEGETLRQKLTAGALTQRKAVDFGLQLARGLAAAHDKGIVHRDLKPENIMITKDGRLKILDFGLAKLSPQVSDGPLTQLPTSPGTQPGMILGTVGYMSPEQVRGKIADHRSDIFAFGAILYEMITGTRAFRGETSADTLSAILQKDPPEISETNRSVAPALSRIVQHCLEKDPEQRFHSAGDIAFNLESLSGFSEQSVTTAIAPPHPKPQIGLWQILFLIALVALGTLGFLYFKKALQTQPLLALSVDIPAGNTFNQSQGGEISISPDGKFVAFCAQSNVDQKWYLWIRNLDQTVAKLVQGTDGAMAPFWSPDSQYVAFFTNGKLKKVRNNGTQAQTICDAPYGRGGSWSKDGTIIFAPQPYGPLYQINATGGSPAPLTKVSNQQSSHRWPYFLPDGKHFVFTGQTPDGIFAASLDAPQPKQLNSEHSSAIFVEPNTLLFVREGNLIAQPFDPDKLAFTADGAPILEERIQVDADRFIAFFSVSQNHSLIYRPQMIALTQLSWFDRSGKRGSTIGSSAPYFAPSVFSRDGSRLALTKYDLDTGKVDIWSYEFASDRNTRLTMQANTNGPAIWTPDGSRIIFSEGNKMFSKQISAAAPEELLLDSSQYLIPTDCSPDGKLLLMNYQNPRGDWDIWILPLTGDKKPYKFIETTGNDGGAVFSPDGKWVAFSSDTTGQTQVYVTSFPDAHQQLQISTEGGPFPKWRNDGKEVVYLNQGKLMSVDVNDGSFGNPKLLFELPKEARGFQMAPDGQRFLILIPSADQNSDNIHFVSNWTQLLKR